MKSTLLLAAVLMTILRGTAPATAQRARRSVPPAEPSPVSVTRSITLRVTIASDSVGIFSYLTDTTKLAEWFPDQAIMESQLGGKYHFRWKDEQGVWSGVVTEFIRGNTLAYTWTPPGEDTETIVRFKLFPQGAQTIVELTESGLVSGVAEEKAIADWSFYLRNLRSVIEEGTDLRRQARRKTSRPASRPRP